METRQLTVSLTITKLSVWLQMASMEMNFKFSPCVLGKSIKSEYDQFCPALIDNLRNWPRCSELILCKNERKELGQIF